ncbi:MAG TPA: DUF302 domain-containing protein [Acidobacteriaceae bacterium]|nr:DUF302 domain-containing protein [Acidobacteriaceae bacterium]
MPDGIRTLASHHPFEKTIDRLQTLLIEKGVTLFALVDHSGEAAKVGLKMPPTKLLIFGAPKAGTPLMLAAPSIAIDLPLKILVAEQPDGTALLSWNDPAWLRQRHNLPAEMQPVLAAVEGLAKAAAS